MYDFLGYFLEFLQISWLLFSINPTRFASIFFVLLYFLTPIFFLLSGAKASREFRSTKCANNGQPQR